jgi:hypothetical protein
MKEIKNEQNKKAIHHYHRDNTPGLFCWGGVVDWVGLLILSLDQLRSKVAMSVLLVRNVTNGRVYITKQDWSLDMEEYLRDPEFVGVEWISRGRSKPKGQREKLWKKTAKP